MIGGNIIEDNFWNTKVDFRDETKWKVYAHTSPNGKMYVGITKQKPEKRWQNGRGYKYNYHFSNAIKKYGWENFEHEIVADHLTKNEACEMEKTLIKELNLTDGNFGYNIAAGGEGVEGVASPKFKDLTGQTFGRLTVLKRVYKDGIAETLWLCKCSCGKEHITYASGLLNGSTKSCGCLSKEHKGDYPKTHGMSYKKIYRRYIEMKCSCYNKNDSNYHLRGAKGIKVCSEWENSFEHFYKWAIENGYKDGLCLYRKDIKLDFCPENCQWITLSDYRKLTNKGRIVISCNGQTHNVKEWSQIVGLSARVIRDRIRSKNFDTPEKILFTPLQIQKKKGA